MFCHFRSLMLLASAFVLASCMGDDEDRTYVSRVAVGDLVPAFTAVTLQGDTIASSSLCAVSDRTIIVFFTTTCPDCQKQLPELEKFRDSVPAEGVSFLCIGRSQDASVVSRYWADNCLTLPCSPQADDRLFRQFATGGVPRIYIINAEGIVSYVSDPDVFLSFEDLYALIFE